MVSSEDLIYEILLRLPVKSLVRFKAVSKSWCSIITSRSFVESHLSARPGDDETLIVVKDINAVSFSLVHLGSCQLVADLKSPYSEELTGNPYIIIVGSARGIVCVSVLENHYKIFTYLWNPATKESKQLIPPPQTEITCRDDIRFHCYVPFGLGFDPIDDDFRVVGGCYGSDHAHIYSANMNAWRTIKSDLGNYSCSGDFGVCVDRFLCWTKYQTIVAFDLNKEVFNYSTKFPNGSKYHGTIAELNNSIVAIIFDEDMGLKSKFGLWMLDDVECLGGGGVEASWTLMLSIDTNVQMAINHIYNFFNGCNLLLSDVRGLLFLYNTDNKESKNVPVASLWGHIFKYKESLVSITRSEQL